MGLKRCQNALLNMCIKNYRLSVVLVQGFGVYWNQSITIVDFVGYNKIVHFNCKYIY